LTLQELESLKENSEGKTSNKILRNLKFFLIPGWRDEKFTEIEYELGKVKSKRKAFRRILSPLTIIAIFLILFITFCAVYAPFLTPYTVNELTNKGISGGEPFALT
jgi:hypothetical protein